MEAFKAGTAPRRGLTLAGRCADAVGEARPDAAQRAAPGGARRSAARVGASPSAGTVFDEPATAPTSTQPHENPMRPEIERIVEEIQQSVALLRRHL